MFKVFQKHSQIITVKSKCMWISSTVEDSVYNYNSSYSLPIGGFWNNYLSHLFGNPPLGGLFTLSLVYGDFRIGLPSSLYSHRPANGEVSQNGKKCQNSQNAHPQIMGTSVYIDTMFGHLVAQFQGNLSNICQEITLLRQNYDRISLCSDRLVAHAISNASIS